MEILQTNIEGVLIIEPKIFKDQRGYFYESYNKRELDRILGDICFVQDNESYSSKGVLRGLHFQRAPHSQSKLVRCVEGSILDISLDIRKGSPTWGKIVTVELDDENKRQIFLPRGIAHGFIVLSEKAKVQYKCDDFYYPELEGGINILDPDLNIDFGMNLEDAILSEKDRKHKFLKEFESPFTY